MRSALGKWIDRVRHEVQPLACRSSTLEIVEAVAGQRLATDDLAQVITQSA